MHNRSGSFVTEQDLVTAGAAPLDYEGRFTCKYSFTAGRPAVFTLRNGDAGYPADPDECEITEIVMDDGTEIDFDSLPQTVQEAMIEEGISAALNDIEDDKARRWDAEEDRRAERRAAMPYTNLML